MFDPSEPRLLVYSKQHLHYTAFKNSGRLLLCRQCDLLWQQVSFVRPWLRLGYSANGEQFAIDIYCLPHLPLTEVWTISVPGESYPGTTHACGAQSETQYLPCVSAVPPEISHTTLRYCKWHWQDESHPDTCLWIMGGEKVVTAALSCFDGATEHSFDSSSSKSNTKLKK